MVLFAGIGLAAAKVWFVGVPVAVVGFAALIGVGMYAAAAGMYLRTILYRFATDQPIPDFGVDVTQAFRTR